MEIQAQQQTLRQEESIKSKMYDIIVDISWAQISQKYFGKSRSWLSQKFTGINGNGTPTEFTAKEQEILKGALVDLSNRIRACAEKI